MSSNLYMLNVKRFLIQLRSRFAAMTHDLTMIPIAWVGAYWLRFNLESFPGVYWHQALLLLPAVMVVQGGMRLTS